MKYNTIVFRNFKLRHWLEIFNKMTYFTQSRNYFTSDEIWFVEHYPIFTQGYIKKTENIIVSSNIPMVTTNRGGQITYHGPGQQILYFLIDLKRRKINIRQLIDIIQDSVVSMLQEFFIIAYFDKKNPGIYVNKKKICSIGLRVQQGYTLHGLSININMDLTPFNYIHPCGNKNIKMTQMKDFNININMKDIQKSLIKKLSQNLGSNIMQSHFI